MFSLHFSPANDAARSTFSQVICARAMAATVLEPLREELDQARDDLASRLRQLIIHLESEGEPVGAIAHDSAYAQLEPAVGSVGGNVYVRLPVVSERSAHAVGQQLLERFQAASLGRGRWTLEVSAAAGTWGLSNTQQDYFGWRLSLPLGRATIGPDHSMAEVEDGLHEAIYGVLLAQAATSHVPAAPPYPGNLYVSLGNVQEVRFGGGDHVADLHHVNFSANVSGGARLFVGVDLMEGSGLIELAKRK